jgi:tyrosyl-tRNA synthetase
MFEPKSKLLSILRERGFVHQATDLGGIDALLQNPTGVYIGFDLTAPSLHVGSLIQLMVLRWVMKTNNTAVVLLGEGTTQIGDPTGKDKQRPLLDQQTIKTNLSGIQTTIERILGLDNKDQHSGAPTPGTFYFENNAKWLVRLDFLEMMRNIGSLVSATRILNLDSMKTRLERSEPLTMLEMIYPMVQAFDFLRLCIRAPIQIGGSDQWGNILMGIDLIRRKTGRDAFGITTPLLTDSSGMKMGKTAGGETIWLDSEMTSPFDFWQFWRNVEDSKVEEFLRLFTELPLDDIARLMAGDINKAKHALATEVTTIVHGLEAAQAASDKARKLFDERVEGEAAQEIILSRGDCVTIADIMVSASLVKSKKDADRLAAGGGLKINGQTCQDARVPFPDGKTVVAMGKKKTFAITVEK